MICNHIPSNILRKCIISIAIKISFVSAFNGLTGPNVKGISYFYCINCRNVLLSTLQKIFGITLDAFVIDRTYK